MEAVDPDTIQDTDLHGWKYFRRLTPLLRRLHDAGCQRDKAGNRTLHFNQYCTLVLLALFSPLASVSGRSSATSKCRAGTVTLRSIWMKP
jgi:hypothetical protein